VLYSAHVLPDKTPLDLCSRDSSTVYQASSPTNRWNRGLPLVSERLHHCPQAMQGLPGLLGPDGMGAFAAGMQQMQQQGMQQGGYMQQQQQPPRLGRSSMDIGSGSPTHSGMAGKISDRSKRDIVSTPSMLTLERPPRGSKLVVSGTSS